MNKNLYSDKEPDVERSFAIPESLYLKLVQLSITDRRSIAKQLVQLLDEAIQAREAIKKQ